MTAERGPYPTRAAAAAAVLPRAVRILAGETTTDDLADRTAALATTAVVGACVEAGVPLGDYDLGVLAWLGAHADPAAVQVIVGLIRRANHTGAHTGAVAAVARIRAYAEWSRRTGCAGSGNTIEALLDDPRPAGLLAAAAQEVGHMIGDTCPRCLTIAPLPANRPPAAP